MKLLSNGPNSEDLLLPELMDSCEKEYGDIKVHAKNNKDASDSLLLKIFLKFTVFPLMLI